MLLSLAVLSLLEACQAAALVPRNPEPAASSNDVCKVGIYSKLAPLAYYGPAKAFCASKYPQIVTVQAAKNKRAALKTRTTTRSTTKSTPKSTSKSAVKPATTTKAATTSTTKCTKDALECLWSSVVGDGAKTFCSCYGPKTTVTQTPTTTPKTTTTTTTTTTTPPATPTICTVTQGDEALDECSDGTTCPATKCTFMTSGNDCNNKCGHYDILGCAFAYEEEGEGLTECTLYKRCCD